MVTNFANKHIPFNKRQCIGHMEPPIDRMPPKPVISVIMWKMMDDQVQMDTFTPLLHHLLSKVKCSLDDLLDLFKSQFLKDKTSIGTTILMKMQIDTGNSSTVLQNLTQLP